MAVDTLAEIPLDRCVPELVELWTETQPDAVAVVGADGVALTYRELNARANQLARYLRKLGVGPDDVVGVCCERSPAMIVALLAVLRAGGAYLPMDVSYPQERLAYMAEDAGVRVLLTQDPLLRAIPASAMNVVRLDRDWQVIGAESDEPLPPTAGASNLAYIIYTSGSTGKPKGVEIAHGALLNLVFWYIRTFAPGPADRATHLAGVSFDASVMEIWPNLVAGASLYLPSDDVRLSPPDLLGWFVTNRISLAFLPTPLAEAFLGQPGIDAVPLRYLFTGGDRLTRYPPDSAPFALVNCYGPTEATVVTTVAVVPPAQGAVRAPSIGRPIAHAQVYLLDSGLQPVPAGEPGELYVGGAGLARGYRNRPELTGEKFIRHQFCADAEVRLYRTGDLARYLPDGSIEYLGRLDNQVKIRGFRVEIGEIETVLLQQPEVQAAVVTVHMDGAGQKRLVAYVVPSAAGVVAADLSHTLRQTLPEYMVPSAFVMLEALPLTANGKVDRRALPPPDLTRSLLAGDYIAPRTPLESELAATWCEVLGADRIGVQDHFFEIGGHSLLATQVLSRVRERYGVALPVSLFFQAPTVARLAECIAAARREGSDLPAIQPCSRGESVPLSFPQQRAWFLEQLQPDSPMFNIPLTIRLCGAVNAAALHRSLQEIVRRHEVLRTSFRAVDGRPVPVVAPTWELPLPLIDFREMPAETRQGACDAWIRSESTRLFHVGQGPLLRAALLQVADEQFVLHLTIHHMVFDGWSAGIFLQELGGLYSAYVTGKESPLSDLAIQYADFARWQRNRLQGAALEDLLAHWRKQLAGAPTLMELPTDRPRSPVQTNRGGRRTRLFAPDLIQAVRNVGQREGATLFMTLLAAFNTLLYRYSGQADFLVGAPIANRTQVDLEGLIGFFANTLALRAELSGDPSFRELLARTRQVTLEAFAHQDLPFERLVEEMEPVRNLSISPLVQVVFVLQNAPMGDLTLPGVQVTAIEADRLDLGNAKFDLTLLTEEQDGGLYAALEYNADLFDPETAERMLGHYERLLEGIVADPEQRISAIPLLSDAEWDLITGKWNETEVAFPKGGTIHERVSVQAQRTPDAIAVVGADGTALSYRELTVRANQVAHHLQRLGAGPGTLVGVCAERTPEMIVAQLGALKAGAAYLPMDPSYPPDRLAYMAEDAQVPVLLTQERLLGRLSDCDTRLICLDRDWSVIGSEPAHTPVSGAGVSDVAYVIYTSGSTGRPKGVPIPHAGLMNLVDWYLHAFDLTSADRSSHMAGVGFDASVFEIWPCLAAGAALYLPDDEVRLSPTRLRDWVIEHGITVSFLPTPLAESLLTVPGLERVPLRYLHTGGERLTRYPPASAPFKLVNNYGPTENTVVTTAGVVAPSASASAPSIGRPIANTRVYLLDPNRQPVPIGVPGELYAGGAGLACGYLNRPELTSERFIDSPFEPGQRLYRTGDLARYLPNGTIEYLGRLDHQVKIRGFRIELGEIEAVLSQIPGIREAVVVAREDVPGQKRLVAYVVPGAAEVSVNSLRSALQATLPEYMIPSAFVVLDELPLTPNGKVDRRALPVPEEGGSGSDRGYAAPRNDLEQRLAQIWADILKVPQVGINDNFFSLGGHSLLTTEVVSRIRVELQLELPVRTVYDKPTIAQLAEAVARHPQAAAAASVIPGRSRANERHVEGLLANLDQLSEEELDALLNTMAEEESKGD